MGMSCNGSSCLDKGFPRNQWLKCLSGYENHDPVDTDMLHGCFGGGAGHYPDAADWAKRAVPFFMQLSRKNNGKRLTVPG